ncbi:MAG: hotdog fold thioesterase [Pseudomonadota bacterium]
MRITDTVQALFNDDRLMQLLGAELLRGEPGHVVVGYTVQDTVVQRHGSCHGGVLFSLADAAVGIAATASGSPAVTQHCSIHFMRPAALGSALQVTAVERSSAGRSRVYDVTIVDPSEQVVAELRCSATVIER